MLMPIRRTAAGSRTMLAVRLGLLSLALPSLAFAGGSATIQSASPSGPVQMDVQWRDGAMRLDPPTDENAYLLVRDGKAYSVGEQGGRTMVLDLASLREMGQAMGAAPGDDMAPGEVGSLDELEATGERESVAGLAGEIYNVRWTDVEGNRHEDTAVLSEHALALDLSQAFGRSTQAISPRAGDAFGEAVKEHGLGVLRFSDKFEVVAVSGDAPPAAAFELPAEPMSLEDLMRGGR